MIIRDSYSHEELTTGQLDDAFRAYLDETASTPISQDAYAAEFSRWLSTQLASGALIEGWPCGIGDHPDDCATCLP